MALLITFLQKVILFLGLSHLFIALFQFASLFLCLIWSGFVLVSLEFLSLFLWCSHFLTLHSVLGLNCLLSGSTTVFLLTQKPFVSS